MRKRHILILIILMLLVIIMVSCFRAQEKPLVLSQKELEDEGPAKSEPEPKENQENASNDADTGNGTVDSLEKDTGNNTYPVIDIKKLAEFENKLKVVEAFPKLSFKRPLDLQNASDGSGRIFVVEQGGKIFVINGPSGNNAEIFLDISDRVDSGGNEEGLLGLAFHPDFNSNGQFFVNYTSQGNTFISRFRIYPDNEAAADSSSEEVLLKFLQPYSNHNGGQIAFNSDDGYLYIATGDGGSGGDPQGNGQNLATLLGKILRINTDEKNPGLNYSIPPDNPFAGNGKGYQEEIYAYGLRNPWRFSFDENTGKLWAADVGQSKIEEINIIQKGKNYGWNIMEGSFCYNPPSGCDPEGLILPVFEYEHPLGKSITGGYVYNGKELPFLQNVYVYADFVSGYIWGLALMENQRTQNFILAKTDLNISSFGIDEEDELYFTAFDGKIYKLAFPLK